MKINNATPMVNKNQNVAFKGAANSAKTTTMAKKAADGFQNLFTLTQGGPMSRKLFIVNAFAFLLGTRLLTSRDKDEIRETLIRDVPTIIIAVLGVPMLGKVAAKAMQQHSGFALLKKTGKENGAISKWMDSKLFKLKSPAEETAVANYSQLNNWYVFDKNSGSGFKGFAERLSSLGGNVKQIFSKMDGFKDRFAKFSDNNEEFIAQLFDKSRKTEDNVAHSDIVKDLSEKFADKENSVQHIAAFKKTITELSGYAATIGLCGLIIPKSNIAITEALHKGKSKEQTEAKKA